MTTIACNYYCICFNLHTVIYAKYSNMTKNMIIIQSLYKCDSKESQMPYKNMYLNVKIFIQKVTVQDIFTWQGQSCYDHIDPHFRTFDGR